MNCCAGGWAFRRTDRPAHLRQWARDWLVEHHAYIREHGQDMPGIREWKWSAPAITSP